MNLPKAAKKFSATVVLSMAALMVCAFPVRADLLQLVNGDHYRGTVISMNSSNIEFLSEIQGRVSLPRNKVAGITFHEVVVKPSVTAKPAAPTVAAPLIVSGTNAPNTVTPPAPGSTADAVVQQLRQQGLDPKLIDQVQEQIFGKASPEAAQKFNELMGGLLTGRVSVQDIRTQAENAVNQIKSAKKELGGEAGGMLDGYLSILEKFMQESGTDNPAPAQSPTPAPAPSK